MLTDWERRQFAEIERGLAEDFAPRSRVRRLASSLGAWGTVGAFVLFGCVAVLSAIGAWWAVATVAMLLGISAAVGLRHQGGRL